MKLKTKILTNFSKGFLMGTCDIIPGISGGTIALLTQIYEKILTQINNSLNFTKKIITKKTQLKNINKELDLIFITSLLLGIITAIFTLSHAITYLIQKYESATNSFFLGLIIATIFFISKKIKLKNHKITKKTQQLIKFNNLMFLTIGTLITFNISILKLSQTNHSNTILFFSGFIAICAMILPGISGAFILLVLNQYEYILQIIKNFQITKITIFVIGAILGITIFTKILNYLLKNFKNYTFSTLLGLILGSLNIFITKINLTNIYQNLSLTIIGFLIVFIIETSFKKINTKSKLK